MEKRIIKTTVIYTVLGFLPLSFAFVFTPIYLKYLTPEEYGILNLFNVYSGILANIYTLGVSSAFGFVYWDHYKDKNKLNNLLASTLGLIFIVQILFLSVGFMFGDEILTKILKTSKDFSFYPYGLLTLIYPVFAVFYELLLPYYRNEGKIKLYASINILSLIFMTLGSVVGIVILNLKAEGAIIGKTLGYSIIMGSFVLHLIVKVGINLNLKNAILLLKFGFPLMISTIIGGVAYSADRIMVEHLSSLSDLGVYGLAVVIVSFIEVLFNALNNALSPTIFKYMKEDYFQFKSQIQSLCNLIVLTSIFAIGIIIFISKPVLNYIAPEEYFDAMHFIPILAISLIFRVFSSLKSYVFYIESKTKMLPLIQVLNLIIIFILSYFMYQYFGTIGIAYAVFLAKFLDLLIVNFIVTRISNISLEFKNLYIVIFICAISILFIVNSRSFLNIYLLNLLPLIVSIIAVFVFAKKELQLVIDVLKGKI